MPKVSGFSLKKYFPYYVCTVFFVKVSCFNMYIPDFLRICRTLTTYIRLFFLICCRKNKKSSDTLLKNPECTSRGQNNPDTFREKPEYTDRGKIIPTLFGKTRYVRIGKKIFPTLSRIVGNIRYGTILSETLWQKKLYISSGGKKF